jgi:hypothetical protein
LATIVAMAMMEMRDCVATSSKINLENRGTLRVHRAFSFDELTAYSLWINLCRLTSTLPNNEFIRVFSTTSPLFSAEIDLHTSGGGDPAFLHGTCYLVDSNGQPSPGFEITGSSSAADLFSMGLFPLLQDQNGTPNRNLSRPLDFFRIHFDLTLSDLQDPLIQITTSDLGLISEPNPPFGIGPNLPADSVPDAGSTLILFTLA